jgi:DNA-binding sugar fermentation-stimulating protein
LSKSPDPSRKTPYTVEAVSLNRLEDTAKSWIGINQNAANRYVGHYLENGGFGDMVAAGGAVHREKTDNLGFQVVERSTNYEEVSAAVGRAVAAGVESWQVNFKITPSGVELAKYFRLSL